MAQSLSLEGKVDRCHRHYEFCELHLRWVACLNLIQKWQRWLFYIKTKELFIFSVSESLKKSGKTMKRLKNNKTSKATAMDVTWTPVSDPGEKAVVLGVFFCSHIHSSGSHRQVPWLNRFHLAMKMHISTSRQKPSVIFYCNQVTSEILRLSKRCPVWFLQPQFFHNEKSTVTATTELYT